MQLIVRVLRAATQRNSCARGSTQGAGGQARARELRSLEERADAYRAVRSVRVTPNLERRLSRPPSRLEDDEGGRRSQVNGESAGQIIFGNLMMRCAGIPTAPQHLLLPTCASANTAAASVVRVKDPRGKERAGEPPGGAPVRAAGAPSATPTGSWSACGVRCEKGWVGGLLRRSRA